MQKIFNFSFSGVNILIPYELSKPQDVSALASCHPLNNFTVIKRLNTYKSFTGAYRVLGFAVFNMENKLMSIYMETDTSIDSDSKKESESFSIDATLKSLL